MKYLSMGKPDSPPDLSGKAVTPLLSNVLVGVYQENASDVLFGTWKSKMDKTVPCDQYALDRLIASIHAEGKTRIEDMIENEIFPILKCAILEYSKEWFLSLDQRGEGSKGSYSTGRKPYFRIPYPPSYSPGNNGLDQALSHSFLSTVIDHATDHEFASSDKNRKSPMITFYIKPEFIHWLQGFPLSKAVNDVNTILSENALLYDIAILRMWNKQKFLGGYIFRYSPKGMDEVDQEAINSLLRKAFHLYYKGLPVENPSASSDGPAEFAQFVT